MHHKLLTYACLLLMLPVLPRVSAPAPVPGRVVVKLKPQAQISLESLDLSLPPGAGRLHPRLEPIFQTRTGPLSEFYLLTYDVETARQKLPSLAPAAPWVEAVESDDRVLGAAPDAVVDLAWTPDDPMYLAEGGGTPQFHLHNADGLSLRASKGWPFIPAQSNSVVVAVIDTGVDWRHPDLGGETMGEGVIWSNPGEAGGIPGVDDDGNGKVDDFIGWDFVDTTNPAFPGEDRVDPDNDPIDFNGHGTQVAGFVNAKSNNGQGIAGHPFDIKIMAMRAGYESNTGDGGVLIVAAAQSIEYAALNGADVINCSFNSVDDPVGVFSMPLDMAINEHDVVVVSSAGNHSTSSTDIQYIASRPDVMAVAGLQEWGKKASRSNFGSWVNIAGFYRPPPTTYYEGTDPDNHKYSNPGGTSFSAPQVAGLAALVRLFDPGLNAAQVRSAIIDNGQDLSTLEPTYHLQLGGGLADLASSIQSLGGGWDAPLGVQNLTPVTASLSAGVGASGTALFNGVDGELLAEVAGNVDDVPPVSGVLDGVDVVAVLENGSLKLRNRDGEEVSGVVLQEVPDAEVLVMADVDGDGSGDVLASSEGTIQTSLGWSMPGNFVVVGDFDDSPGTEVAGVTTAGVYRTANAAGQPLLSWEGSVQGPLTAPPLGVEFGSGEFGHLVLASTVSENVQSIDAVTGEGSRTGFPVQISGPPIVHLSAGGYLEDGRVRLTAVDQQGELHLVHDDGTVTSVSTGAAPAGEIIWADISGDNAPDLVALGADGTVRVFDLSLNLLEGFPRYLPATCSEAPVIRSDSEGRRLLMIADDAGDVWGLPMGVQSRPAPWPTAGGSGGRTRYLDFETATPLISASLTWQWLDSGSGRLCASVQHTDPVLITLNHYRGTALLATHTGEGTDPCIEVHQALRGDEMRIDLVSRTGVVTRGAASLVIDAAPTVPLTAHPSPFTGLLTVGLPESAREARVSVFDVGGRLAASSVLSPGTRVWTWNGSGRNGTPVPPGVYWVRWESAGTTASTKVIKLGR